ncbi:MAG: hypothetical protein D6730_11215 [Bacteroidetes bacterium]|nr:MAG: hypothetical protein D6730_11215 [Bacteroidota bacterium]
MNKTNMYAIVGALLLSLSALSWVSAPPENNAAVSEGAITYVLDMESDEIPAMAQFMLNGSGMVMRFKGDFVRTEFNMSMMSNTTIIDGAKNEGLILMSVMGQNWAIKMDKQMLEQQNEQQEEAKIVYSDETKKIAGYTCKKATIETKDGALTMYYTEKIQPKNMNTQYTNARLKGAPLQFEMKMDAANTVITMIAKEVSTDKQDPSLFSLEVPDGYEVKTMEELQSMQGK